MRIVVSIVSFILNVFQFGKKKLKYFYFSKLAGVVS